MLLSVDMPFKQRYIDLIGLIMALDFQYFIEKADGDGFLR